MRIIDRLIDDYTETSHALSNQIDYLERGNQIHIPGQDSAKATAAWLAKLKRSHLEYGSILATLRQQAAIA
jgi:hypothetical protein